MLPPRHDHPSFINAAQRTAEDLARWAIKEIGQLPPRTATTKAHKADWVTPVDVMVEQEVRQRLAERFPDHLVIGEELDDSGPSDAEYRWFVDPVDGTTNFVHNIPGFTFSLAMADRHGLVCGVVADPWSGEVMSSTRGEGAFIDQRAVSASDASTLAGQVVLVELAGYRTWQGFDTLMTRLQEMQCVVRILGSSALSVSYVGCGRAAAAVLGGNNPIDVAAGVLFAREAGALVLAPEDGPEVLGCDPHQGQGALVVAAPGIATLLKSALA